MQDNNTYFSINKSSLGTTVNSDPEHFPSGIVICLDKPYTWTSADAVRKIKFRLQRFFNQKNIKVGHAGTLDPLATGVLLICVGKATKKAEILQAQVKEYIAEIRFGCTTPSFDLEKEIDEYYPFEHITKEGIEAALPAFIGKQNQIPPVFSAKLIDGKRAYDLARAGIETEMKASVIEFYEFELISFESPSLLIRIKCSKGTYIRSFARDLATSLGSGGHLTNLRRTSSGQFHAAEAVNMSDLESLFIF